MICNIVSNFVIVFSTVVGSCLKLKIIERNDAVKVCKYSFSIIKALISLTYLKICQYLNKSVRKVGKNKYEVTYFIEGKMYKFITKKFRGPCLIERILDDKQVDKTDIFLPYCGVNYDIKQLEELELDLFCVESLTIEFTDGRRSSIICK